MDEEVRRITGPPPHYGRVQFAPVNEAVEKLREGNSLALEAEDGGVLVPDIGRCEYASDLVGERVGGMADRVPYDGSDGLADCQGFTENPPGWRDGRGDREGRMPSFHGHQCVPPVDCSRASCRATCS